MRNIRITVIGLGGIGSCLLPVLYRYLSFTVAHEQEIGITMTLIDGDSYETRNQARQSFTRIGNKAEVCAEMFTGYDYITTRAVTSFIDDNNVAEHIRDHDIVLLCVHGHAVRKLVSDWCEELKNVVLISGGNELTDGNIQVFIRENSTNKTLPLANDFHEEIMFPQDLNPADSCERVSESAPQIVITNNAIAAAMLNALYAHFNGLPLYDEAYVDIATNRVRSVVRSSGAVA